MHVRTSVRRQGDKEYRYVQVVQSYRREKDGMPAHRVVGNLGNLGEKETEVLRKAFRAMRTGSDVVVVDDSVRKAAGKPVLANLRYLDVGVGLAEWQRLGLGDWLDEAVAGEGEVAPSKIVASLAIQRCVAPGSKLKATRWFPKTALPELLGVSPHQFNNTRIHRVMAALEKEEKGLQDQICERVDGEQGGLCQTLFLDLTDVWFEGEGPTAAKMRLTKEGLYRKKVGIALMCNEKGYPLRWQVVAGNRGDAECMWEVIDELTEYDWFNDAPLVMDRAMGTGKHVARLAAEEIQFLTAIPVTEFETYTTQVPHAALGDLLWGAPTEDALEAAREAGRIAVQEGMQAVDQRDYVLDLGLAEIGVCEPEAMAEISTLPAISQPGGIAAALAAAAQMKAALESGAAVNYRDAGRQVGLSHDQVCKRMDLLKLAPDIRESIGQGEAEMLSLSALRKLSRQEDRQKQREQYDRRLRNGHAKPRPKTGGDRSGTYRAQDKTVPLTVRLVLHFNAEQFVEERNGAHKQLADLHGFVRAMNRRLATPHSRRGKSSILGEVGGRLRRLALTKAFQVQLDQTTIGGKQRYQVRLERKESEWAKRRRYDGFNLLVANRELHYSPETLMQLYRTKDKVEKDFQTIKSQLEIRPVRHFTDPKVRAHVTICMLALLLERRLEESLKKTSMPITAEAAFEILESCHLNRHPPELLGLPSYSVTSPDNGQAKLLALLDMEQLVDDEAVAEAITPR